MRYGVHRESVEDGGGERGVAEVAPQIEASAWIFSAQCQDLLRTGAAEDPFSSAIVDVFRDPSGGCSAVTEDGKVRAADKAVPAYKIVQRMKMADGELVTAR